MHSEHIVEVGILTMFKSDLDRDVDRKDLEGFGLNPFADKWDQEASQLN